MKKTFFLVLSCSVSMILFAQKDRYNNRNNSTPPPTVEKSYQKDYSNYNHENWDMRNNRWHTRYTDRDHGNRTVDVYYDRNGRRMQSESTWNRDELPQEVKDRIRRKYHDDNYQAMRIEKPGRGFYFQITLGGNRKVNLDERGREVRY